MGLDNGIVLKIKDKEKFGGDRLPSWMPRADWEDEGNYPWEILYWRNANAIGCILDTMQKT